MINAPVNDATNSTDRIQELFDSNQRMIGFFLSKYPKPTHLNYDEYVSELTIALWKSCRTYDSSITKFSTYAFRGMFMARGRLIQKWKRSIRPTLVEKLPVKTSCVDDMELGIRKCESMQVINLLSLYLTRGQREVLYLHLAGKCNNEIARILGRSPTTIGERFRAALRKMRVVAKRRNLQCPI